MNLNNSGTLQVGIVSSCQMVPVALQALFRDSACTLAWHYKNYEEALLQRLFEQPVHRLILSLNVYQTDLLRAMQLIQNLKNRYPQLCLLVVLDVNVPYLVSRLQGWGVQNIINLTSPLDDWKKQLFIAGDVDKDHCLELVDKYPSTEKTGRLSPIETRIVRYLIEGNTVQDIATLMMRSVKTVSSQKNQALHKIGISHYAQLVAVRSVLLDSLNEHSTKALFS